MAGRANIDSVMLRRRIFVYGTLRRGAVNHRVLAGVGATFERAARTAARYELATLGPYPALLPSGAHAIEGEVWTIDEPGTAELDRFEDVPNLYVRGPIELEDGEIVDAYLRAEQRR